MADGVQCRRRRRPKLAEALNAWLYARAEALHRKPDADGMDETAGVDYDELYTVLASTPTLGYPLDVALLLWRGWEDHGQLAVAGGILDQPRQWRRLIQTLNYRLSVIESAVKAGERYDAGGMLDGGTGRDLM